VFVVYIGNVLADKRIRVRLRKGKPAVRRGVEPRGLLAVRYSRVVEQSSGATRPRPKGRVRKQSHIKQPYETDASPMVGVLLGSELVLLLGRQTTVERAYTSEGNREAQG
jgi:hypothetical protein